MLGESLAAAVQLFKESQGVNSKKVDKKGRFLWYIFSPLFFTVGLLDHVF